ncbi:MAG: ribosome small subunit-dependent GTPase A [Candidatus Latescibacteria bacterium]|nr:ribosome small subunit-dependent GTPase A [Candidatus Latescibacterota bacterium]
MPKSVYYGTNLEMAHRITGGDYSVFADGMLSQQTFLSLFEAIGAAERSRSSESDVPAVVQLLIKDRSFKAGNKIKIKNARLISDQELHKLTGHTFNRKDLADLPVGLVVKSSHKIFIVRHEDVEYQCSLRRRLAPALRTGQRKSVMVGDRVKFRKEAGDTGVIEAVLGRKTEYARMTSSQSTCNRHAVGMANVDALVIVSAVKFPPVWVELVDRFLVLAESAGIEPLVCINKIDLLEDRASIDEIMDIYERIGYNILVTSVSSGEGIEQLKAWMRGKISSLVGLSGVGKSSLMNELHPDLQLATQQVNERRGGRHTTSNVTLFPLEGGGFVADTPGIRELDFLDVLPQMIHQYFPEMKRLSSQCDASPCYHRGEPNCAVLSALQAGDIAVSRYKNYVSFCSGGMAPTQGSID